MDTSNDTTDDTSSKSTSSSNSSNVVGSPTENNNVVATLIVHDPVDHLVSHIHEEGLTKSFVYSGYETHAEVKVVYRDCRQVSKWTKNQKKTNNKNSSKVIRYLVEKGVIHFGLFNSQHNVNIHCSVLNKTSTGMVHLVTTDGHPVIKPSVVISETLSSGLEPDDIDRWFKWRISFDKPRADVYVKTRMMIDIARRAGEPYFSCPFFVDLNCASPIVRNYQNMMMNPEVQGLNEGDRSSKRQRRLERDQERRDRYARERASTQNNNHNPRWNGAYDI